MWNWLSANPPGLRDQAAEVTEKLSDLPPELDKLTGHELKVLDEREGEIQKRRDELVQAKDAKAGAVRQLDSIPLAEPLPEGKLQTWRGRADSLVAVETELATAQDDHAGKKAAVAEATHAVGGQRLSHRFSEFIGYAAFVGKNYPRILVFYCWNVFCIGFQHRRHPRRHVEPVGQLLSCN